MMKIKNMRGTEEQRNSGTRSRGFFSIPLFLYSSNSLSSRRALVTRGFTLLIAVLMGSVLLAIGYAIYNILSKEIILSSSGRDSQFAFYAADSGIECALYWDNKQDAFSTTSAQATLSCGGSSVPVTRTFDAGTGIYTNAFSFPIGTGGTAAPCADVSVKRLYNPTRTTVESAGYNTCDTTNPRRLERSIRVSY